MKLKLRKQNVVMVFRYLRVRKLTKNEVGSKISAMVLLDFPIIVKSDDRVTVALLQIHLSNLNSMVKRVGGSANEKVFKSQEVYY